MVKSFIFPLLGNGNNNLCLKGFWFRLIAVVEKQSAQYQALQWTVVIVLKIQHLPRQSISVLNSSHTYMQLSFCLLELSFCLSVLFGFIMFYYFPHVHGSFFLFLTAPPRIIFSFSLSLGLEWKLNFSSPVATAEFSKCAGILSAALSQHHLSGFEIAQLEFHHLH